MRAAEALKNILRRYGQLLPLGGEYVLLFNVTCVLDALDEQKSKIVRFDDGDILTVEKHEFVRSVIAENEIFKLPSRSSPVFVTDGFVKQVRDAGLRGVSFELVWTDIFFFEPRPTSMCHLRLDGGAPQKFRCLSLLSSAAQGFSRFRATRSRRPLLASARLCLWPTKFRAYVLSIRPIRF